MIKDITGSRPNQGNAQLGHQIGAQDNPMKFAFTACKIGIAAYVIPFLFAQSPALLGQGSWYNVLWAVLTAVIGTAALAGGSIGYFINRTAIHERVLFVAGTLTMLYVGFYTDLVGMMLIGLALVSNIKRKGPVVEEVSGTRGM